MSCIRWIIAVAAVALLGPSISTASAQGILGGNAFRREGGLRNFNESRRSNNNNSSNDNYGNNYGYEQPATYYAPVAPAPASTATASEIKPKGNDALSLNDTAVQAMSAKLAARQQTHASQSGGKINAAMEQYLAQGARGSAITNIAQAQQEWRDAVVSSEPNDYRKFQSSFRAKLAPEQRMWLDTRVTLLQYEQDLKSGYLTQAGKDARLDEIQNNVAVWPASPIKAGVQDSLNESGKFNDLAKLLGLTASTENAIALIVTGLQNARLTAEDMSELTGLPFMGIPAIDDSAVTVADILIMNPEENGEPVNYNIGSHGYTMKPGEKQSLTQSYVLSFDPGDGTPVKQHTLTVGVYQFVLSPGAWELRKITPKIRIDNRRYHGVFHYLINGKEASVEPYRMAEHTGSGAMVVQFDRGDGGSPARKVVADGTLVVGVEQDKICLNLFDSKLASQSTHVIANGSNGANTLSNDTRSPQKQIEEALARLKARGN